MSTTPMKQEGFFNHLGDPIAIFWMGLFCSFLFCKFVFRLKIMSYVPAEVVWGLALLGIFQKLHEISRSVRSSG